MIQNALRVVFDCSQNCPRGQVEHLNETRVIAGHDEFPVVPKMSGPDSILEPGNGFHDSVRLGSVHLQPRAASDYVTMGGRRGKVNIGDCRIAFDECC